MPELPELEVVCEVLERRVVGLTIQDVEVLLPGGAIVVRDLTNTGFGNSLVGKTVGGVIRRGKFLVFSFLPEDPPLYLAINPKLSGRLKLADSRERRRAKTHVIFSFENGQDLRYIDQKQMGQLYLDGDPARVPGYAEMGPEALAVSLDEFRQRLKPFRGEIKGVLIRDSFVAGIGNAYADEILWEARIHPYRKRTALTGEEIERIYAAMRKTLLNAIDTIRVEMGENIEQEPREFFAVHMKSGQACPRCGGQISAVTANQRMTNFCRTCQPGGLIKGM